MSDRPAGPRAMLTAKRQRFVDEYVIDNNGTQAAIRAGYAVGSADVTAARLLGDARIAEAIADKQSRLSKVAEITAERILNEADLLATSDIGELFDLATDRLLMLPMRDWPAGVRKAVASIKIREYPEKLPPLGAHDVERLEKIVSGKGYDFDISRAIPEDDRIWLAGFVKQLRKVYWDQYRLIDVKLWDKNAGLDKAMKRRGLLKDSGMEWADIRKRLVEQIDSLRQALPPEEAEKAIAAIRPVWVAA